MGKKNPGLSIRVDPSKGATTPKNEVGQKGNEPFWKMLEHYNQLPASERAEALVKMGIVSESDEVMGIISKSHFVIPGKTRYECQMCGECCRYARKVATLTYEPCPFLSDTNRCTKHDSHYLVCRWFPFYVHHDKRFGDLLTIKPYCHGYGKGELVNYESKVQEINQLAISMRNEEDGAWVIHEVLYLPDKGEWTFPSRTNIDHLLRFLGGKDEKQSREGIKHRSAELDHAQHYTSGLLGSIRDPQLTVSEDGTITDLNNAMESLCKKERNAILESRIESLFINPAALQQTIKQCFSKGKIAGSPHRMTLADGSIIPVLLNAITYRDRSDGLVHGALVCIQPVSVSVFNDLLQSQSYARSLLEANLDPLVFLDLDGSLLDVNDATVKITGANRENLIGSNFTDYFTDPVKAKQGIDLTLSEGMVRNFELELKCRDGTLVPVQFNASAYRDLDGAIKGVFAAARDVRESKKLIADLMAAKDYARGLIESSLDLMVTVDRNGSITDVNEAAVRLSGKSRESLIGTPFYGIFSDPMSAKEGVEACFRTGSVRNFELLIIGSEDVLIPVSFNASVYRDRTGKVQGVFGIARDIRERLKMLKEVEEARNYARGLIESSPDLMVTIDKNGFITDVNKEALRLTGKRREELIGSRFSSFFDDPDLAEKGVRTAFSHGSVRNFHLMLKNDRASIPVSFNASLYRDSDGRNILVFAIARKVE